MSEFETAQEIYLSDRQLEMKNYAQIMSKLQKLRDEIKGISANGRNNFNNFDYIRLKDILKVVTPLMNKYKLATHHRLWVNPPLIDLVDTESGYSISFGIDCSVESSGKNTNQVLQSLGTSVTYLRKYIYLQIFDLYDEDPDKNFGKESSQRTNARQVTKRVDKPSIDEERLCSIARQISQKITQDGLELNDENKHKVAKQLWQQQEITPAEYRQIRKLIDGDLKIHTKGK